MLHELVAHAVHGTMCNRSYTEASADFCTLFMRVAVDQEELKRAK